MPVKTPMSDSVPRVGVEPQGHPTPTRHLPTAPAPWISSSVGLAELQHWDNLSLRPEIPVAGRFAHFLPFWQEVIQPDRWVLEAVSRDYSVELLQTSQF